MGRKQMNRQISSRMGNVIKLSILNLNVFTAKFAEKAQRAAEFLFGEPLCETLRKPMRLSAVIFVTFSVNLTTLPGRDGTAHFNRFSTHIKSLTGSYCEFA